MDSVGFALAKVTGIPAKIYLRDGSQRLYCLPNQTTDGPHIKLSLLMEGMHYDVVVNRAPPEVIVISDDSEEEEEEEELNESSLSKMSVRELKRLAEKYNINIHNCLEKGELVTAVLADKQEKNIKILSSMSIKELKGLAAKHNVNIVHCLEKGDLIDALKTVSLSGSSGAHIRSPNSGTLNGDDDNEDDNNGDGDNNNDNKDDNIGDDDDDTDEDDNDDDDDDSDEDDDDLNRTKKRRNSASPRLIINDSVFDTFEVQVVRNLPYDIDGICVYKLEHPQEKKCKRLTPRDGRPWGKPLTANCKSQMAKGTRKIANCKGSYVCKEKDCLFVLSFQKENRHLFKQEEDGNRCAVCSFKAEYTPCTARKIVEFHETHILVKHYGIRTCEALEVHPITTEATQYIKSDPRVRPRTLQRQILVDAMRGGKQKEEILNIAATIVDRHKIRNEKKKLGGSQASGNSIEALLHLKVNLSNIDKYLAFEINDERQNNKATYVFKTSKHLLKIADMNRDGTSRLSKDSYTPRTLRACCSQSKFRILKIRESSARALFLYNCTPNISCSADASVSVA